MQIQMQNIDISQYLKERKNASGQISYARTKSGTEEYVSKMFLKERGFDTDKIANDAFIAMKNIIVAKEIERKNAEKKK